MIEPELHEPSISRQCQLFSLSRSSFYYAPVPITAEDLELMRLIDEQYLKTPTYGSRSMARHFWRQGRKVNRKRIQRLMRLMGIEAVYPTHSPVAHALMKRRLDLVKLLAKHGADSAGADSDTA